MLSKKCRAVGGSLLFCVGYLPLISSVFFRDSSVDVVSVCCTERTSGKCFFGNPSLYDEFNLLSLLQFDSISSGDTFSVRGTKNGCNSFVASLSSDVIDASSNNMYENVEKTSAHKNVSPIKIVSVGEYKDARIVRSNIKSNFYSDARSLGIPVAVINSVINNLSGKIDFRRALKSGDSFEILYSNKNEMLYTKIKTKHKEFSAYRFKDGKTSAYFFENGEKICYNKSSSGTQFGKPLMGHLSVSDKFGWRRHPVTGKMHKHNGVDLKAKHGTPVLSVYDGVVVRASRYSGYGHCIDIKHPSGYTSRYAHLSRYNVSVGSRVRKGQQIGNVGSSGLSTGPHLHLELAKNNVTMNPFNVKMVHNTEKASKVINKSKFQTLKKQVSSILLILYKNGYVIDFL